jgi:hypothetical protein
MIHADSWLAAHPAHAPVVRPACGSLPGRATTRRRSFPSLATLLSRAQRSRNPRQSAPLLDRRLSSQTGSGVALTLQVLAGHARETSLDKRARGLQERAHQAESVGRSRVQPAPMAVDGLRKRGGVITVWARNHCQITPRLPVIMLTTACCTLTRTGAEYCSASRPEIKENAWSDMVQPGSAGASDGSGCVAAGCRPGPGTPQGRCRAPRLPGRRSRNRSPSR